MCDSVTCPAATSDCKVAGICQESDGQCTDETNAVDGTECDDGDAGTDSDTCTGGVCAGAPIVVDCVGEWGEWGACSEPCGGGTRSRSYAVSVPAANGGTDCAVGDGESDTEDCNTDDCPCTRPTDAARYDLTDAVEVLDRESFDVTGVTCATGYAGPGDAQATLCAESGAAYTLMGCFRLIKLTLGLAIEDIVEDEFKADFQKKESNKDPL